MSLPKKDVRTHVLEEAHNRLTVLATASDTSIDDIAGDILNRAMLGEGYKLILAAGQAVGFGIVGNNKERL